MSIGPAPNTPAEISEDEYVVSLGEVFRIIWKRLWVVVLVTVLLVGAAVGYSIGQTPIYEGSIRILIGQKEQSDIPGGLGGDVQGLQQLTQTMAEAVNSRPVAQETIERLELRVSPQEFLENLSVEQIGTTQFIRVDYRDPGPERARQAANTVGEVFSEQVSEISPSANSITANLWERAVTPEEPVSPNPVRNGLLAMVLGLMLGAGLAFLLEYLDDSWRSPEEVERIAGVPTFGIIPEFKVLKGKKG